MWSETSTLGEDRESQIEERRLWACVYLLYRSKVYDKIPELQWTAVAVGLPSGCKLFGQDFYLHGGSFVQSELSHSMAGSLSIVQSI